MNIPNVPGNSSDQMQGLFDKVVSLVSSKNKNIQKFSQGVAAVKSGAVLSNEFMGKPNLSPAATSGSGAYMGPPKEIDMRSEGKPYIQPIPRPDKSAEMPTGSPMTPEIEPSGGFVNELDFNRSRRTRKGVFAFLLKKKLSGLGQTTPTTTTTPTQNKSLLDLFLPSTQKGLPTMTIEHSLSNETIVGLSVGMAVAIFVGGYINKKLK